jgi:shikimate dehydrogenase
MGAVNCVVRRGDKLIGENTDGKGFVTALRTLTDPTGKRVVMFGAGGAARAIGVELALSGVQHITIVNRSDQRGRELADLLASRAKVNCEFVRWHSEFAIPPSTDVVINATSIGLFPDGEARLALDPSTLKSTMIVADVIPNPPKTRLIRDAAERGCTVIDGLGMLVNQGVIGIEYWTGMTPDADVMRRALEDVFG